MKYGRFIFVSVLSMMLLIASACNTQSSGEQSDSKSETPKTEEPIPSEGLEFELSANKSGYEVVGNGTCTDTEIIIPEAYRGLPVISIAEGAFRGCRGLTGLIISDTVTTIGDSAFVDSESFTYVVIGKSVSVIGDNAFLSNYYLQSVYYKGTEEDWGKIDIGEYNGRLEKVRRYYYSETEPDCSEVYWHYVDGRAVVWRSETEL